VWHGGAVHRQRKGPKKGSWVRKRDSSEKKNKSISKLLKKRQWAASGGGGRRICTRLKERKNEGYLGASLRVNVRRGTHKLWGLARGGGF